MEIIKPIIILIQRAILVAGKVLINKLSTWFLGS